MTLCWQKNDLMLTEKTLCWQRDDPVLTEKWPYVDRDDPMLTEMTLWDWATWTYKNQGELRWCGRVRSSCSSNGSRHVTLVTNLAGDKSWLRMMTGQDGNDDTLSLSVVICNTDNELCLCFFLMISFHESSPMSILHSNIEWIGNAK
jgi:hypothetical protein